MRLFDHEYTIPHPWPTVTAASWQKYPNPEWTPHITHVDYVSRHVDADGRLHTERLLTCQQSVPSFLTRLLGLQHPPASIVYERSVVDPRHKLMTLHTQNLTFSHLMRVQEYCSYRQDSTDPLVTHFGQECRIVAVDGWAGWLAARVEEFCVDRFQVNAQRGRQALQEAIDKIEQVVTSWKTTDSAAATGDDK